MCTTLVLRKHSGNGGVFQRLSTEKHQMLTLAGSLAFERKDFAAATHYWTQARQLAPAGSEFAKGLDRSVEAAQAAGGGPRQATANT